VRQVDQRGFLSIAVLANIYLQGILQVSPTNSRVRARAPLRLGFAGGGTDVSPFCDLYGGLVMNATINLYAVAHLEPCPDGSVHFYAADVNETYEGLAEGAIEAQGSALLHKGVYNRMVKDFTAGRPIPVRVRTTVDVPAGSGLGSSSTLMVALIEAFRAYLGLPLGEYDVARLAFEIERQDLGLSGGRQDQYAAAFGGFNFMEFSAGDRVIINPLRIKSSTLCELESSILLCYSGKSRVSAEIIDRQARNIASNVQSSVEGMMALRQEAIDMKEAILKGDVRGIGAALHRGWTAKRATASGISTSQIDLLIENAIAAGAYAGKVSGAGGGGFLLFLADPQRRHEVAQALVDRGGVIVPCNFTHQGVESWRW
jgi:D-glycero-alpha-D-manno-heptose-7-phosphate kinase